MKAVGAGMQRARRGKVTFLTSTRPTIPWTLKKGLTINRSLCVRPSALSGWGSE